MKSRMIRTFKLLASALIAFGLISLYAAYVLYSQRQFVALAVAIPAGISWIWLGVALLRSQGIPKWARRNG